MRRSLAAYWLEHGEGLLSRGVSDVQGEQDADPATAAFCGVGGVEELFLDEEEDESRWCVSGGGVWAGLTADELRATVSPFLVRERKRQRTAAATAAAAAVAAGGGGGVDPAMGVPSTDASVSRSRSAGSLRRSDYVGGLALGAGEAGVMPAAAAAAAAATLMPASTPSLRSPANPPTPPRATTARPPVSPRPSPSSAEKATPPGAAECGRGLGSELDFDASVVLRCLSPRHLCLVMSALLCERKVVMVSARLSLLTMAGEVFRSLLQPLSWSHVYVPLLPRRMAGDLLQCPTPFLLGLDAQTAGGLELPRDAIQVHLDTDYILAPKDFVGLSPMSVLCARLCSVFNPGVEELDYPLAGAEVGDGGGGGAVVVKSPWNVGTSDSVRFLFREFVSELLQGAAECTFEVGQGSTLTVLLDERLYKRAKSSAAKAAEVFYERTRLSSRARTHGVAAADEGGPLYNRHCGVLLDQFVKTQMLSHFLTEGAWE